MRIATLLTQANWNRDKHRVGETGGMQRSGVVEIAMQWLGENISVIGFGWHN